MKTKQAKITVVGSINVDMTAFTPHFPVDGETVVGDRLQFGPGGKGLNQATAASRAGGEVIMVAKIGRDFLSSVALDHFRAEGMSEKHLAIADDVGTGSAIIEVSSVSGENKIIIIKGANEKITAEEVLAAENEIASSDIVLTQLESSFESVRALIETANKHHIPVVLNPAPFQSVPEGLFDGVDYFTPNETEAEYFSGIKVTDEASASLAADRLMETLGVKHVIITLGKKGAYYKDNKKELLVAPPVMKAVDTTGAGDSFNGGLCVALSEGMDIKTALEFANCTAAISVTRAGAAPAMAHREEIDELYASFYGKKES